MRNSIDITLLTPCQSQCGNGNNSLMMDAACPFCQWVRGPYDETYDPNGEYQWTG